MKSHLLRFLGQSKLPAGLTQQDIDEAFSLSTEDIGAITGGRTFTGRFRLGVGVQIVMLRATGRTMNHIAGVPRLLLHSLCQALGTPVRDIATLRSIYDRPATLSAHLDWIRRHTGFRNADAAVLTELEAALQELSHSAPSVDDLVRQAECWLYERSVILPGERVLRSVCNRGFEVQEQRALAVVREGIEPQDLQRAMTAVFSHRRGPIGSTVLEWLRTPPAKHGATTLRETTQKVVWLKALGVHRWDLSAIPLVRLQAYRQAVIHRPPSDTARLSEPQRALQLACFLYGTLLELTDLTVDIAGRRACDLIRSAKTKVQARQAQGAVDLRAERAKMHGILWAPHLTPLQRVEALRQLLPREVDLTDTSRAALVREALVVDSARVTTLLNSVAMFDLHGDDAVLVQVQTLRDLAGRKVRTLPDDFDVSIADPAWQPLLRDPDRGKALAALKACALTSMGRGLKGGQLWLSHSWRHRNREEQLIAPAAWQEQRSAIVRALSLTANPDQYLERVIGRLQTCLQELHKAVENEDVTIDAAGRMHLPNMAALDADPDVDRTRTAMFDMIGPVQQADMLVQVDVRTGFSRQLLGRPARSTQEIVAVYGSLLAHGTENDARGVVAMVPGLELTHLTAAMRTLEARGRLREANRAIVDFQQRFAVAKLWGSGEKGSADSMSLDTSRHLHSARLEYRRRQPAVGLYTHVMDSYGLFYDQPIMLNTRQAAPAVQGVEWHNAAQGEDGIRLSLLAVDTHGYTNAALTVGKLLGFDLCVWLRDLAERKLYLPAGVALPEGLERLAAGRVSLRKIRDGWDPLLRLVASIRRGLLSPKEALERLGSAAAGDPMRDAADALGKLLRTIFLCDFLTQPGFRRELRTLLNRGESVHQLQRAIYHGRLGHQRGRRREELVAVSGAHALLTNAVIAWNTMKMQEVVDRWKAARQPVEDTWIRRMGPVHFGHINFRGTIAFPVSEHAEALLERAASRRTA